MYQAFQQTNPRLLLHRRLLLSQLVCRRSFPTDQHRSPQQVLLHLQPWNRHSHPLSFLASLHLSHQRIRHCLQLMFQELPHCIQQQAPHLDRQLNLPMPLLIWRTLQPPCQLGLPLTSPLLNQQYRLHIFLESLHHIQL